MKDTIEKMFSLGLGVVVAGKEQVEKTVEELVKKGEVNRAESKELIDRLVKKGEEARQQMETATADRQWATREDIERIHERLDALERRDRKDE
ncbi:phasin family protein [Paenibacillus sp. YIM B09110]|uniref:phasin family protein n=1 Tax=Paenibacillus sp. YIM B09110 TaxID=3126102 RepID=UPI00301D5DDF